MGVRAIDVSSHQGAIDWHAVVGDGVRAAWVKVGGADATHPYKDARVDANLAGAQAAGLVVGTYYFCHVGAFSPVEQARHAVTCGHGTGVLWPAADLEAGHTGGLGHSALDDWLEQFCAEVARITGRVDQLWYGGTPAGVGYSGRPMRCGCWISNYGARDTPGTMPPGLTPPVPPAWGHFDVWQFNSTTRVAGITANTVDQNVITDDLWARMTSGAPADKETDVPPKSIHIPPRGDAQWLIRDEGNGKRRKEFLSGPRRTLLVAQGSLHPDPLVLTPGLVDGFGIVHDELIAELDAMPEVPPMHAYEAGVANTWQLAALIRDTVAAPLARIEGRAPADIDVPALVQSIAQTVSATVSEAVTTFLAEHGIQLDVPQLEQLNERLATAGLALAGAPQT